MAAQEQTLNTRSLEANVLSHQTDPRCMLYKEAPETVQHITAGCKMLAGKADMEHHNQVARMDRRSQGQDGKHLQR